MNIYLILHNIRSVHNVGSIFRTADAAGVSKMYLTGFTPTPLDRFGRARKDLAKVSLGAEQTVPWEYRKSAVSLLSELHKSGVYRIAVEQTKNSLAYLKIRRRRQTAFVFGNEVQGLPPKVLACVDAVAEIPMRGALARESGHPRRIGRGKESLNVAVAAGIILFGTKG